MVGILEEKGRGGGYKINIDCFISFEKSNSPSQPSNGRDFKRKRTKGRYKINIDCFIVNT